MYVLELISTRLVVCRMEPDARLPEWVHGSFWAVVRTPEELSVVCEDGQVPDNVLAERGWRGLKVQGQLDFALTGVLASIAGPLAQAEVSIFAISTYNTDYVLIKENVLDTACHALQTAGFSIVQ